MLLPPVLKPTRPTAKPSYPASIGVSLSLTSDGFKIVEGRTEFTQIPWSSIQKVRIVRGGLLGPDVVWFEIHLNVGRSVIVHEHQEGYCVWEQELERRLPGYDVDWLDNRQPI